MYPPVGPNSKFTQITQPGLQILPLSILLHDGSNPTLFTKAILCLDYGLVILPQNYKGRYSPSSPLFYALLGFSIHTQLITPLLQAAFPDELTFSDSEFALVICTC